MQINDKFFYINIRDYLALGNDTTKRKLQKLLSFYRDNRFSQFDTRQTTSDTDESHELVQLLRLL